MTTAIAPTTRCRQDRPRLERLAHDLRSAYSPVSIGITMLRSGRLAANQEAELLAAMQRQSETIVQMLDDISDLVISRHGAAATTSVANLFQSVAARTAARLADAGVAFEARTPAEPATVLGETRGCCGWSRNSCSRPRRSAAAAAA